MMTPQLAQAALISSIASAYASASMPAPPCSAGIATPRNPSSAILATISPGQRAVLVELGGLGGDFACSEVARGVADHLVLFGQIELHELSSPRAAESSTAA